MFKDIYAKYFLFVFIFSIFKKGDMYTLIAMDPDVPVDSVGTEAKPLLHWLVTNIPGGNVNSGEY